MLGKNKGEVLANSDSIREGVICAICLIHICDRNYLFVIKVRPVEKTISLSLREICVPNGNNIEFSQVNYTALYVATNKKLISLHVTITSYSFLYIWRSFKFKDNIELYKYLIYEE